MCASILTDRTYCIQETDPCNNATNYGIVSGIGDAWACLLFLGGRKLKSARGAPYLGWPHHFYQPQQQAACKSLCSLQGDTIRTLFWVLWLCTHTRCIGNVHLQVPITLIKFPVPRERVARACLPYERHFSQHCRQSPTLALCWPARVVHGVLVDP